MDCFIHTLLLWMLPTIDGLFHVQDAVLLFLHQTLEVFNQLLLLHQVNLLCLTQDPHLLSLCQLLFFQFLLVFSVFLRQILQNKFDKFMTIALHWLLKLHETFVSLIIKVLIAQLARGWYVCFHFYIKIAIRKIFF